MPKYSWEPTDAIVTLSLDRVITAGNDLADAAEMYFSAVDNTAIRRSVMEGWRTAENKTHLPLAWDQLQQAEEVETECLRAMQRALYYWRKVAQVGKNNDH